MIFINETSSILRSSSSISAISCDIGMCSLWFLRKRCLHFVIVNQQHIQHNTTNNRTITGIYHISLISVARIRLFDGLRKSLGNETVI